MKNEAYEALSKERKELQAKGDLPMWFTTMGWMMIKNKEYLHANRSLRETFEVMATTAARHLTKLGSEKQAYYQKRFFELLWDGHLGAATPVFNLGTPKGCPVSCAGSYVGDSVLDFYESALEAAMLTKECFGTSSYLGDIRPRGSSISRGGESQGVVPVFKMMSQVMTDVSQGTARRGSWAGYLPLSHGDFDEIVDLIMKDPEGRNLGIIYHDDDLKRLAEHEPETIRRYQKHMTLRAIHGKGYFWFVDRVKRMQPPMYAKFGLENKASNLCSEITLAQDIDHSYTCCLSSLNLARYDEWKDTDAVEVATVFLDCVISEFLAIVDAMPPKERRVFERVYQGTVKSRALGLGVTGFHTLLRTKMIPFESSECKRLNIEIFKHIHDRALEASQMLARELGEPEWCVGFGVRNTHRTAVAPTMSNSIILGTVSPSIEPEIGVGFSQKVASGTIHRLIPEFSKLMSEKGRQSEEEIYRIVTELDGSVQTLDYLSDFEKEVFKTAYEIDQKTIIDLAADRAPYICQHQSINLMFDGNAKEEEISDVHLYAAFNPQIKGLYYMRSKSTSKGSQKHATEDTSLTHALNHVSESESDGDECLSCQG